ncbi:hypothetical protein [Arthrobacter sp. PsM3]|uniref:hypothetical protein n=1 Tax=Arthrobacter sp. PsM3 TaxID=3030531 RepID=UPI00263BB9F5|nr:hypothetical protein [Arthrobacter sp. PsM3]MDN4646523.1 hypothetical protein [Arthrobacter sp. PsM3]
MTIRHAVDRVFGQALLLIPNFFVSITAAHQLQTSALAAFFIAWTIESQWIAGIRAILVPTLVLHESRPRALALFGTLSALALVPGGVMFFVAYDGGLDFLSSLALAFTPLVLGALDCVRSISAKSARRRGRLLIVDAAPLVGVCGVFGLGLIAVVPNNVLTTTVGVLAGSMAGLFLALKGVSQDPKQLDTARVWLRASRGLLLAGIQEWAVFAFVGLASIGILNELAGPEAVAGIRLAETLLAPLGVLALAVPVAVAPMIRSLEARWPGPLKLTAALLMGVGFAWISLVLLVPASWVAFVVGDHGSEARMAVGGLAAGAMAGLGASVLSIVLKRRNQLKKLRAVRWLELAIAIPCVAVGALGGTVASAAASISVFQVVAACALVLAERMSARGDTNRRSQQEFERVI